MTAAYRPSLLYLVPGHDFLPSAGPTRNALSQARAMRSWADVSLAFRRVASPPEPGDPPILEIDPATEAVTPGVDDAATRGMTYRGFLAYLPAIRRFLAEHLPSFDVVLEKDWMLTGYGSRECRRRGVPGIPVKNWVPGPPPGGRQSPVKALKRIVATAAEGRLLRELPCLVAETPLLKEVISRRWKIDPARIEVIGMGVDRKLFAPSDRAAARSALGIDAAATVLLYAGVLDRTHDLEPVLRALAQIDDPRVQLQVIGDGARRAEYESLARATNGAVFFHGRVPHTEVPRYVAAADLCLAPYDPAAFPGGQVAYSTLKVREYLSAGRPVAAVDSGSLRGLVRPDETGYLLANSSDAWVRLLQSLPGRTRLAEMGVAAAGTYLESWGDVSEAYRKVCLGQLAKPGALTRPSAAHPVAVQGG